MKPFLPRAICFLPLHKAYGGASWVNLPFRLHGLQDNTLNSIIRVCLGHSEVASAPAAPSLTRGAITEFFATGQLARGVPHAGGPRGRDQGLFIPRGALLFEEEFLAVWTQAEGGLLGGPREAGVPGNLCVHCPGGGRCISRGSTRGRWKARPVQARRSGPGHTWSPLVISFPPSKHISVSPADGLSVDFPNLTVLKWRLWARTVRCVVAFGSAKKSSAVQPPPGRCPNLAMEIASSFRLLNFPFSGYCDEVLDTFFYKSLLKKSLVLAGN